MVIYTNFVNEKKNTSCIAQKKIIFNNIVIQLKKVAIELYSFFSRSKASSYYLQASYLYNINIYISTRYFIS
jgi:hypothetical protein